MNLEIEIESLLGDEDSDLEEFTYPDDDEDADKDEEI